METELQPITGDEDVVSNRLGEGDPCTALIAFYKAFNQRDLALMENNWSHSAEASMSNPLGDVRRGWPAIRAVYKRIFGGAARVYVEFYDYSLHTTADMFCAVGRERGYVVLEDQHIDLAIRTSRIYRKEGGRWRQLHHHGSIDSAELLARYQAIVTSHSKHQAT